MGRNSRKKKQQRRKAALARVRKTTPEARRKPVPVMYTGWYGFGDPPGEDGLFDDCPVCEKMRELGYSGPLSEITDPDHLEQIREAGRPYEVDLDSITEADLEAFAAAIGERRVLN